MPDSLGKLIRDLFEENKSLSKALEKAEKEISKLSQEITARNLNNQTEDHIQQIIPNYLSAALTLIPVVISGVFLTHLDYIGSLFYQFLCAFYCGYILKKLFLDLSYKKALFFNFVLIYASNLAIKAWSHLPYLGDWIMLYSRLIFWPLTGADMNIMGDNGSIGFGVMSLYQWVFFVIVPMLSSLLSYPFFRFADARNNQNIEKMSLFSYVFYDSNKAKKSMSFKLFEFIKLITPLIGFVAAIVRVFG